jgi:hypothetical protein
LKLRDGGALFIEERLKEDLLSNIAYKKESKRNFARCDCIIYSPTQAFTADLKVYQVIIKRDGQSVTTSNNTTIVGERINLTAEVRRSTVFQKLNRFDGI